MLTPGPVLGEWQILGGCRRASLILGPSPWCSFPLRWSDTTVQRAWYEKGAVLRAFHHTLVFTMSPLLGRAENYWWRGLNTRTLCVGPFPRNVVTSVAGLSAQDISQPLQNSFIHTGHGDSDRRHCWGFPDKIDE